MGALKRAPQLAKARGGVIRVSVASPGAGLSWEYLCAVDGRADV